MIFVEDLNVHFWIGDHFEVSLTFRRLVCLVWALLHVMFVMFSLFVLLSKNVRK